MIKKLSPKIFTIIKKNYPFSCVDIILVKEKKFFLVKRKISPYKNKWCLPGGIIKRNQKINHKIMQIGKEELGINLKIIKPVGFYEKIYPDRHDITHCFLVMSKECDIVLDHQASNGKFFVRMPSNTALFFKQMLRDAGFT